MRFRARNLQFTGKSLPLHQFFIVLDFKVNKGWSTAVLLFYLYILKAQILLNIQSNRSASYSQNGKTVFE